jgi:hypothetical protein
VLPARPDSTDRAGFRHPEIHVIAGRVVVGVDADDRELVERVWRGQDPQVWSHYRLDGLGRQICVDDHDARDEAIEAARTCPLGCPVFEEVDGALVIVPRRDQTR